MTSSQQFREMCEGTVADNNLTQGGNSSNDCFDYLAEFISNIKGGIGPHAQCVELKLSWRFCTFVHKYPSFEKSLCRLGFAQKHI